jgi:hypothetical protein
MSLNLIEQQARELAGMGDNWRAYHFEAIGNPGAFVCDKITGAVVPLITRGNRKGRPNWKAKDKATIRVVYITKEQHEAWLVKWEQTTGKCSACEGSGQRVVSASVVDGTKYKPCGACKGTGLANRKEQG